MWLITGILALVTLSLVVGSSYVGSNSWNIFQRGIVNSEKKVGTTNPITRESNVVLENKAQNMRSKVIKKTHDGANANLKFNYFEENGKLILVRPPTQSGGYSHLIAIPGSDKYMFEFEGSLYSVDIVNGTISKILKDEVGPYSLAEARKPSQREMFDGDSFVWWGSQASMNPNGTNMVFYTNRSGTSELWAKDFQSGEEKKIFDRAFTAKEWINAEEVIGYSGDEIFKLNISTGEAQSLGFGHGFALDFVSPYIVMQKELGSVDFVNINNDAKKTFTHKKLNRIIQMDHFGEQPWVAFISKSSSTKYLFVVHTEDFTTKLFEVPSGQDMGAFQWKDDHTILVTVKDESTGNEQTVFVEILTLRGDFF